MTAYLADSGGHCSVYDLGYVHSYAIPDPNTKDAASVLPSTVVIQYDPIIRAIALKRLCVFGRPHAFPLSPGQACTQFRLENPPDDSPLVGNYDFKTYGQSFAGLSVFISALNGGSVLPPSPSGEKFCRHATFTGYGAIPVSQVSLEPVTARGDFQLCGVNSPVVANIRYRNTTSWSYYSRISTHVPVFENASVYYRYSLTDMISELAKAPFSFGDGTQFWRVNSSLSNVSTSNAELRFTVTTTCAFQGPYWPYTPCTYSWKYSYVISLDDCESRFRYTVNGDTLFWDKCNWIKFQWHSFSCTDTSRRQDMPDMSPYNDFAPWPLIRGPVQTLPPVQGSLLLGSGADNPYNALKAWRMSIDAKWNQVTPSALYSSVAAIADVETGTQTDVLQTLYKLPEYESMVPKLREALDVLGHIARKDISGHTMKEIMDLATGTILQSSFQWRPLLQLLTTEIPKIFQALTSLWSRGKLVTGRGRFDYDLKPGTFNRPESHLVTRSKIVLDLSARALAANLLGLDGLGVMPKPSNLWDLVPFSFALNWITGVGQGIRRMEYAALMTTIPAYYVHTYALTSPFTAIELDHWDMATSTANPLSMKVFYRDVSLYSPLPYDSELGFGIPSTLPPLGTVASLLWQVLT